MSEALERGLTVNKDDIQSVYATNMPVEAVKMAQELLESTVWDGDEILHTELEIGDETSDREVQVYFLINISYGSKPKSWFDRRVGFLIGVRDTYLLLKNQGFIN